MPACAPRYHDRIHRLLAELDDRSEPIAETCRRVGAEAERLGLTRPSYVHLRRLIQRRRALQDARLEARRELLRIASEALWAPAQSKRLDPWQVEDDMREVLERLRGA